MLNINTLESDIQNALEEILEPALEQALKTTYLHQTKETNERCKNFASTATNLIAEPLSIRLASAIDYHVRSAELYGGVQLITVGSPITQQAILNVATLPTGLGGGIPLVSGPNILSLGIK